MFTLEKATQIFPDTLSADVVPALTARFSLLSAEDQLALIWFAYLEMGKTITIAAPGAARMQFAEPVLNRIKAMTFAEQSQVMVDLANRSDTDICRTYAIWSVNIKLGFWYRLGEWMEEGIVAPIPEGYQLSANAASVLSSLKGIDAGQQITVLRNFVVDMGFDPSKVDGTERIAEPIVLPTAPEQRTKVAIAGIDNPTILSYMDLLNANDFDQLIQLFLPDGALQPPFQRPIVGTDAILRFFREDCQNLKLLPETGVSEPSDGGFTQIKVTGKVQTPWFGAGVGMNVAWRFLLDPDNKIYFVAIDLLASPAELLKFAR
ncbi:orange carotenoid-binding protein [Synechococcus sp. BA-120 BA3]|nr:orange carotenoid-binding protein [Synechococcus sp. BA-120 BA3]